MSSLSTTLPPRGLLRRVLRSPTGFAGGITLAITLLACLLSLPWTLGTSAPAGGAASGVATGSGVAGPPRYDAQSSGARLLPPSWAPHDADERRRADAESTAFPARLMGTDLLGRDLFVRLLTGGAISLLVGACAAAIAVSIGTAYGLLAGYLGGRIDAVMMRIVDVLFGLPYVLLVVLLAVASDALLEEYVSRGRARDSWVYQQAAEHAQRAGQASDRDALDRLLRTDEAVLTRLSARADAIPDLRPRELSAAARRAFELGTLLIAIGGVSWLTMARVVRGQVLALKAQPFVEAARAMGASPARIVLRHILPNLAGPVVVYATLTVPQAILQESFLSFLGIGVRPPLPSWGNLAAEGLWALNPVRVRWWLLAFPCGALCVTLLALNFLGEGLREALDPKRVTASR